MNLRLCSLNIVANQYSNEEEVVFYRKLYSIYEFRQHLSNQQTHVPCFVAGAYEAVNRRSQQHDLPHS